MKSNKWWWLVVFLSVSPKMYAICTISVISGVNFGNYTPFGGNVDMTGQVQVSGCVVALTYSIALNAGLGSGGSFFPRKMSQGSYRLNYNLYTAANRLTIWGNGSPGTSIVRQSVPVLCNVVPCVHTVYGRIPGRQTSVVVGAYVDTITVTLTF